MPWQINKIFIIFFSLHQGCKGQKYAPGEFFLAAHGAQKVGHEAGVQVGCTGASQPLKSSTGAFIAVLRFANANF